MPQRFIRDNTNDITGCTTCADAGEAFRKALQNCVKNSQSAADSCTCVLGE